MSGFFKAIQKHSSIFTFAIFGKLHTPCSNSINRQPQDNLILTVLMSKSRVIYLKIKIKTKQNKNRSSF